MRISFRDADWQAIARLWAEYYPAKFEVDAELLRLNSIESPLFDWGASAIEVMDDTTLGFVMVKKSPNPTLWPGPNQDTYHICSIAFGEPEVGVDLMSQAKQVVAERGGQRLLFGMDSRHFFPGCPEECQRTCNFLLVEGFESAGEHFDLERDLQTYKLSEGPPTGIQGRELQDSDVPHLRKFMGSEFPGRWEHDVLEKVKIEGAGSTCFGAFEGDSLLGFALIQDWRHKLPIGGAVWRKSLGDHWGSLGPIGIAKAERGRGVGHALLGGALMNLKERGVRRCIIDWTTLDDFYGRHGFEVTRRYKTASLKLD